MGLKCKLIHPVGKRIRILFGNDTQDNRTVILDKVYPLDTDLDAVRDDPDWDMLEAEYGPRKGWGLDVLYDTPTGKPGPGDMFWHELSESFKNYIWDNSDGKELHVILPNGEHWNIDSRARNCTLPNDRTHRCWVRTGIAPNITISKDGHTCSAGAGSIASGNYHGFLRNGELT